MSGYRFDLRCDDDLSQRFQVAWQSSSVTLLSGYSDVELNETEQCER